MNKYQQRQQEQEKRLIAELKAKPGVEVFPYLFNGCVMVATTKPNGVSQRSVWLGRAGTVDRLKEILAL